MKIALIVIASVIVVFVIPHIIVLFHIFNRFFRCVDKETINRKYMINPNYDQTREVTLEAMKYLETVSKEEVSITSFDGLKLTGDYFDSKSDTTIIMFHGALADPYINFAHLIKMFLEEKYNVLVINQRGHYTSEGKYVTYGDKEKKDALSWIEFVGKDQNIKNIFLYGMSLGGTSLCLISNQIVDPRVKGMFVDCAYTSVNELLDFLGKHNNAPTFLFMGGFKFLARHIAKVDFKETVTEEPLKESKIPTLFIHGTSDDVAPIKFFNDNYNNCASEKDQFVVEGAMHTTATIVKQKEAVMKIKSFIKEHIQI